MLAPVRYKTVFSYVIGWLTSLAWIATVATETLFAGTIIQGIMILDNPAYAAKPWQGTLLTWVVILGCILINVVLPSLLPRFEVFILVFHLAGFVAIVATLWAMTPEYSAPKDVWATALNKGGWPTQGLSYCIGFLGNVATFVGADASVHLAEEVSNPAKNIPRAILGAMLINGAVGFIMMVTVLYCLGDIEKVVNTATGYPFIQVFFDSTGSIVGATVMAAVVLILTWSCAIGITTTASRMTWSFARDNGLPASKWLSKVDPRTKVPVIACLVVTGISALLTLIYIGSDTAFNDVISLTITGFYGSYFFPAAFLLYHRIKGNILPKGTDLPPDDMDTDAGLQNFELPGDTPSHGHNESEKYTPGSKKRSDSPSGSPDIGHGHVIAQARLIWGPWHLPGIIGTINNAYACVYMIFVIFWSVWPPATPVTASTMNYSAVVTGGVMILSTIWYFVRARKVYKGPTVDKEVARVMRVGSVVSVS